MCDFYLLLNGDASNQSKVERDFELNGDGLLREG